MLYILINTLCFTGIGMTYGHLQWKNDEKNSNVGPLPIQFYSLYLAFFGLIGLIFGFIMGLFL